MGSIFGPNSVFSRSGNTIHTPHGVYTESMGSVYGPKGVISRCGDTSFMSNGSSVIKSGDTYYGKNGSYILSGGTLYGPGGKAWYGVAPNDVDIIIDDDT